jgi:hypothetical protein
MLRDANLLSFSWASTRRLQLRVHPTSSVARAVATQGGLTCSADRYVRAALRPEQHLDSSVASTGTKPDG